MKERQGIEIRKWMLDQTPRLTGAEISRAVAVNKPLVGKTIDGERNNRKVLRYLVAAGCPVEIMDLPGDIDVEEILRKAA